MLIALAFFGRLNLTIAMAEESIEMAMFERWGGVGDIVECVSRLVGVQERMFGWFGRVDAVNVLLLPLCRRCNREKSR